MHFPNGQCPHPSKPCSFTHLSCTCVVLIDGTPCCRARPNAYSMDRWCKLSNILVFPMQSMDLGKLLAPGFVTFLPLFERHFPVWKLRNFFFVSVLLHPHL